MTELDEKMFEPSTTSDLNYVSRGELKGYAQQLIYSYKLDQYHIERKWKIPPVDTLKPMQKIVAYILLDLHLATVDKNFYNIVPEVGYYKRRADVSKGANDYIASMTCLSSFRTICPEDNTLMVSVCVEDCDKGGIINIQTTSSVNDFQKVSDTGAIVDAIGLALQNLFYKLSTNKPEVTSVKNKFDHKIMTNTSHPQNTMK